MFRGELLDKGWPDDSEVAMLAGKAPGPEAATYTIQERAVLCWVCGQSPGIASSIRTSSSASLAQSGRKLHHSSPCSHATTILMAGDAHSGFIRRTHYSMNRRRQTFFQTYLCA
jgi:hypothetical protein